MAKHKIFRAYGNFIAKKPWVAIVISLALMVLAIAGAFMVDVETGEVLDENSQEYKSLQKYEDNFGGGMKLFIVVSGTGVASLDVMTSLQDLENELMKEEGVIDVLGLPMVLRAAMKEATGVEMLPVNESILQMLLISLPMDSKSIFLPDANHSIMIVELEHDMIGGLENIRKKVEQTDFPQGMDVKLVGEPVYYDDLVIQIQDDMAMTVGVAGILMMIILGFVFGNVRLRFLPLVMVLIGVLWTLGFMGFAELPINLAVFAVFPILIGLGIDYSINIQNRAQEETDLRAPEEAIVETMEKMAPAVGIALVATCLGFSSLLLSKMPIINSFGLMCVVGVILCYIAAGLFLPAILFLYHKWRFTRPTRVKTNQVNRPRIKKNRLERGFQWVSGRSANHPLPVLLLALVLALGGFVSSFWINAVVDYEELGGNDMQSKKDLDQLRDMIGGTDEFILLLEGEDLARVEVFQWMLDTGSQALEKNHWITGASSIASTVLMANNGTLPTNDTTLKVMLQMLPEEASKSFISEDHTLGVVKITILHIDNEKKENLYDILSGIISEAPRGIKVSITGMPVVLLRASSALSDDSFVLTLVGCGLTFLGLLAIYRKPVKAILPAVPIILVVGWSLGVMFVFDISLNPLTACLGAMVIGLGTEYTILLMERYQEERERGLNPHESIKVSTSRVGRAIFSSGLTTMGGFGALMIASFPFMREFGFVIVINVILCLLSAIVVLPPLLLLTDRWLHTKK